MARRKPPVIADALLDQLLAGGDAKAAFDKDGLLDELRCGCSPKARQMRWMVDALSRTQKTGQAPARRARIVLAGVPGFGSSSSTITRHQPG